MLDHWVWSRYLSFSYYEHPPMIAWLIRGITMIGGNNETALEVGSQLVTISILALVYVCTLRLYGIKPALITLLILCSMPYFTLGSIFLHITQPFLLFWIIALFLLIRYHQQPQKSWLLWIGVAAGLGALSKYIMLLFYIGLFLHLLLYRKTRKELLNPWLYTAGIISLAIFIPVLIWNAQHDWISFRWQMAKGTSGADFGENTLAFTLGHLLLFSPLWALTGGLGIWWLRDRLVLAKSPEAVITVISIFPLLFFTLMSLKGTISDPHWANLAYLGIAILLGHELLWRFQKKTLYVLLGAGLLINLLLTGTVITHTLNPIIDWMPYELKNFDYLKQNNVPPATLQKLRNHDVRLNSKGQYIKHLQDFLTPVEFEKFGELIQKTAMDVSADRLTRVLAWDKTGVQLQQLLLQSELPQISFIVSREYQLSAVLSFFLPNQPWPHSIEKPERNLWSPLTEVKNGTSIFVCELQECQNGLLDFNSRFQQPLNYLGEIETRRKDRMIRNLQVYALSK
ncbi:MAG: glycosyltransferase family 39 protein [SAR324 cluster bacterium]|nr:glycosyltransferase family 39 protein [SAR324 cluster bacterium]